MRIGRVAGVVYLGLRRERQRRDLMQAWRAGLSNDPQFAAARRLPGGPGKTAAGPRRLLPVLSGEAGGLYNESRTHGLGVSHSWRTRHPGIWS